MNEQVKKIYDYVSKMEEFYESKLTCGENPSADIVTMAAMSAYGRIRWFIEDILEEQNDEKS